MNAPRQGAQLPADFGPEERFLCRRALNRLSVHDDTPRRLTQRLCRLEYAGGRVSREAAERVVAFLVEQGLIDEEAYAERLLSALKSRGYGTRRILSAFRERMFSPALIVSLQESLLQEDEEEQEEARATALATARARSAGLDLSLPRDRQRLYAFLARRGFSPDLSGRILQSLIQEEED